MRAEIEIGSNLNSGINGVLLRNCSIAGGETAASQNYIQNFRKNRKIIYSTENSTDILEDYEILAAFKSRRENTLYLLTENKDDVSKFQLWAKPGLNGTPYKLHEQEKRDKRFSFSYDYGKLQGFIDFDCVLVCAYGILLAFSEVNEDVKKIEPDPKLGIEDKVLSGVCAFANRVILTFHDDDDYIWNDSLKASFDNPQNHAASEYGNDMTRAVRRTGSRLAVFTNNTIEIKDLSDDAALPFQGYLYQNNYDVGAIVQTIKSFGGTLYFIGEEMSGLRSIYSLADGALKKLTTETQSLLLDGEFAGAGAMQEGSRTFYCAYGSRSFGMDISNGSLFEIDGEIIASDGGYGGAGPNPPPGGSEYPDLLWETGEELIIAEDGQQLSWETRS